MQAIGSNVNILIAKETTEGETPAGAHIVLPYKTGESLGVTSSTYTSELIAKHRGTIEVKNGSYSVAGSIPTELGFDNAVILSHAVLGEFEDKGGNVKTFKRGKKLPTYTIAKDFSDIATRYIFNGVKCNSLQIQTTVGSLIQVSSDWAGTKFAEDTTETGWQLTPTQKAIKSELMSDLEAQITIGGLTVCANSFNFTINNDLQESRCIGSRFAKTQAEGRGGVSGQVSFAFDKGSQVYQQWLDGTTEKVELTLAKDADTYIKFKFPKCKWGGNGIPAVDTADAIFLTVEFTALVDEASGTDVEVEVKSDLDYSNLF